MELGVPVGVDIGVGGGNNDAVGESVGVRVGGGIEVAVGVGVGGESEMFSSLAYVHPEPADPSTCTHSPWRARTLTMVPWERRVISGDSMSGEHRMIISRTLT